MEQKIEEVEVNFENQTAKDVLLFIAQNTKRIAEALEKAYPQDKREVAKPCPKCKVGGLVKKISKVNNKVFLGCNQYPNCNYSESIETKDEQ